ncbi:radical SAM protein [Candidatus Woesearchaeota archaeon]|nr:radical SAM protein [Candidatus Woesearchaeota archaeon]
MNSETKQLIEKANQVYQENHPNTCWFGRCIFLSWYCDLGTCKFCFRSTIKHKIRYAKKAKRTTESILSDAVIGKVMGWKLEFLTGGYGIFSFEEILEIIKKVSQVYEEKIWINLGVLEKEQLEQLKPYVEGICASIETVEPNLHSQLCPDKPIEPYVKMLKLADKLGFKKSMTVVIGLGEQKEDWNSLSKFIEENRLDLITFYALKPVKGTDFDKSPEVADYVWWIAQTRIKFPKLKITAGLTPKKVDYTEMLLKAGANAITKFPVIRKFATAEAKLIEELVKKSGREFNSSLVEIPSIDWAAEVKKHGLGEKVLEKVLQNVENMEKNISK